MFLEFIARSVATDFAAPEIMDWEFAGHLTIQDFEAKSLGDIPMNAFSNPFIFDYVNYMYDQSKVH